MLTVLGSPHSLLRAGELAPRVLRLAAKDSRLILFWKITLVQWLSNFKIHQNYSENLLDGKLLGSNTRVSDSGEQN